MKNFQIRKLSKWTPKSPPSDTPDVAAVGLEAAGHVTRRHTLEPCVTRVELGSRPIAAGGEIIAKARAIGVHTMQFGRCREPSTDRLTSITRRIAREVHGVIGDELIRLTAIDTTIRFVTGGIGVLPLLRRSDIGAFDQNIGAVAERIATDIGGAAEPHTIVAALRRERHFASASIDCRVPCRRDATRIREAIEYRLRMDEDISPADHSDHEEGECHNPLFVQLKNV